MVKRRVFNCRYTYVLLENVRTCRVFNKWYNVSVLCGVLDGNLRICLVLNIYRVFFNVCFCF